MQTIEHVIKSVTPQNITPNATNKALYNGFGFNSSQGSPLWPHQITVGILRGSTETLNRTFVPALIGFWGNVGGAYTVMVLLYAMFFVLKSPLVETEFSIPGASAARFLCRQVDTAWGDFRRSKYRTLNFASQQGHASSQALAPSPSIAISSSPAASATPSPAISPSAATLSPLEIATPSPDPRSRQAMTHPAQPTAAVPAAGRTYLRQRSGGNSQSPV